MTEHGDPNDRLVSDAFEEAWASRGALAAARAAASIRRRRMIRTGSMVCVVACLIASLVVSLQQPVNQERRTVLDATVATSAPPLEIISDRELLDLLKDRQFLASRGGDGRIREVILFDESQKSAEPSVR